MYKFQKVRLSYNKITIDHDWMLVIESVEQLLHYHESVMTTQIPNAWENLIAVQEGKAHLNSTMSMLINFQAEATEPGKSLIELTTIASNKIFNAKYDAIVNSGKIYVNKNGGFFPHSEDVTVLDEIILEDERLIFPQYSEKDIRIKKWDGGKHYYAFVGDFEVEMHGLKKWNTEQKAMDMAKAFLYRMKNKQFEIK